MKHGRTKPLPYLLTLPITVVLFALLLYPTIYAITLCFQSTGGGTNRLVFVGLQNFISLFTSSEFWSNSLNTLLFTAGSIIMSFILGLGLALILNSIGKGVAIYRTIFILPIAVSPVVTGLTWNMLLNPLYGVVNYLIGLFGIRPLGWTTDIALALPSVVMIDVWQWTPFMMLILYAGLQMLPKEPFEAALIDGASPFQCFWSVTIPLLKPIMAIALIFRGLEAFKAFDVIYTITKGGPGHATETWIIRAYLESFRFHRLEVGAVIGVIMLIVTLIICKRVVRVLDQ